MDKYVLLKSLGLVFESVDRVDRKDLDTEMSSVMYQRGLNEKTLKIVL